MFNNVLHKQCERHRLRPEPSSMAVVWVRWRWRGALKYIRWRAGGAVTQTKLVLTHPNTVRSQRSGALAVKLFYKEIVSSTVCSSLAVLHGDHRAKDRRQRSESIEEVAHGPDRGPAYSLESSSQFPCRPEYKGGCVYAPHVCPRCRLWIRFAAYR